MVLAASLCLSSESDFVNEQGAQESIPPGNKGWWNRFLASLNAIETSKESEKNKTDNRIACGNAKPYKTITHPF
jgi:hypothetical protein